MKKGGAEAVSMNILVALQRDYDVTLLTLESPDFDELNQYYNTSVSGVDVREVSPGARFLEQHTDRFEVCKLSLLNRTLRSIEHEFDLLVSGKNEFYFETPSVQYIHHPNFERRAMPASEAPGTDGSVVYRAYDRLCTSLRGSPAINPKVTRFLANSGWTAEVFDASYQISPTVVHPPIDIVGFNPPSWEHKEDGFVTIGRLSPDKNIVRLIEIVQQLRIRDHDIHLHIVGPKGDEEYSARVAEKASTLSFITLEGEVTRERLVQLISDHKYGIHGKEHEHFGMTVAEFVAGGALPFVPSGGGQVDIVNHREELIFSNKHDAVQKIEKMLESQPQACAIQDELSNIEERFGRKRFQKELRAHVASIHD